MVTKIQLGTKTWHIQLYDYKWSLVIFITVINVKFWHSDGHKLFQIINFLGGPTFGIFKIVMNVLFLNACMTNVFHRKVFKFLDMLNAFC